MGDKMTKLKAASKILAVGIIAGGVGWGLLQRWPAVLRPTNPTIYKLQFGVTVNKFMVINNRLHLLVPLPVTGESGRVREKGGGAVIEIDKLSKKARKGK